ncbi:MAG: hypothetical protein H6Q51_1392, partial [Deltaproteobacteria bacterium]|nr:hypothetical protein [Deltaproteobacteria bacterium]
GQKQEGIGFFARADGQLEGHTSGAQDEAGGLRG